MTRVIGCLMGILRIQIKRIQLMMINEDKINFNKKKIIIKKTCVLCSSKNIKQVINFNKTPLANSYPKTKLEKEIYFNLSCVLCKNCGHLQLKN